MGLLSRPDSRIAPCAGAARADRRDWPARCARSLPHEIALDVAMLGPPAIPLEQRLEGIFEKPAIVKFLVEAEHGNRAHGRLGAVGTLPVSGAGVVGHKALRPSLRAESRARWRKPGPCRRCRPGWRRRTCPSRRAHSRPNSRSRRGSPAKSRALFQVRRSCPSPAWSRWRRGSARLFPPL